MSSHQPSGDAIASAAVLDQGFVELIDVMGDADSVVDAARVSFDKNSTQYTQEQNDKLLQYLRAHHHDSPSEMVVYKFRVRAPVLVWWHWVRHRMASYNFVSGRYVPFDEKLVYKVAADAWRGQSKVNKQGSNGFILASQGGDFSFRIEELYREAFQLYDDMLEAGVAREQARLALPFGAVYYDAIVMMNGRSIENFVKLRASPDAQYEIRSYAQAVLHIIKDTHPRLWGHL